jgi:Phage tail sheath protein FI
MSSVVKTLPRPQNVSPSQSQDIKVKQRSAPSKSNSDQHEDSSRREMLSPVDEFSSSRSPSWDSLFNLTETFQTPTRRDYKGKKDANDRPSTPSFGKQKDDQKDNFLGRPSHQWATSDFVEWDDAFADMPMDDMHLKSNVTIDVKPLPKLRLDLMPAPREEDEDNITQ